MNPEISRTLTDEHIRELRQQAVRSGTGDRDRTPWLRRRIGFAMIEAGTRMLATTRPATD